MAASTSWVLAAGGIAAANELLFVPLTDPKDFSFSKDLAAVWRLVPAVVLLALGMAGLEKAAPEFAVGLSKLLVLGVLVFPVGNAPTPLQNASALVSKTGQVVKGGK